MTKKILAIIPARGGSKGLVKKNSYSLAGKPLISYTIEEALKSKYISKIIISSDDDEILKISGNYNIAQLKRPSKFALDDSSSEEVILHALKSLVDVDEFDILILLQPTSPLREFKDIDCALEMMIEQKASAVISVTNVGVKPFKSYFLNKNGFLAGVHNNKSPNMRRQDLPDAYLANGAIYAVNINVFLKLNSLITDATIPFVMDKEKSYDIDILSDLLLVEKILKKRK